MFGAKGGTSCWAERLVHWWDLNPFSSPTSERGWILRDRRDGALAGFLGLIPACYAVDGKATEAMVPTTWVVDPRHREGALMLGRRLHDLEGRMLIVSTTGHRNFQDRLVRRGWVLSGEAMRQFVPCGWASTWCLGPLTELPTGRHITGDVAMVGSISQSFQKGRGIEKWLTPEYLAWYRQSPARQHRFAGVLDGEGRMTTFLMLAAEPVMGFLRAWAVVDWFTSESDNEELRCLLAAVAAEPEKVGMGSSRRSRPILLRLTAMIDDEAWRGVKGLWKASVKLNHFHCPPEAMRKLPKRCVLAEGDLGL